MDAVKAAGGRAAASSLDIRDPESVQRSIDQMVDQFGAIDLLINNAAGNFVTRAEDTSPNGWNAVIDTVLNGSAYCTPWLLAST